MDAKPTMDTSSLRNWSAFTIVSLITFFCTLINARVFHIMYIKSTLKSRPANILVAHLSAVVIGFVYAFYIYFLEKMNLISLSFPGLCNLLTFFVHVIHNIFSLNIGAIVWVRTRKDAVNLGRRRAFRIIGIIWIIALFGNIAYLFMVKVVKNPLTQLEKCKQIHLLGSVAYTIAHDGIRFIFVNMTVCVYFLQVTFKLRSSVKYLQMQIIQTERTTKHIRQVRFVQRHTILLMITWFPHGLGGFLYRMGCQLQLIKASLNYTLPLMLFLYIVFIICPTSFVFLLENISMTNMFAPCWRTNETFNIPPIVGCHHQNDPEAFGWRVYPPLKHKSNIPVKARSVTWSKKTGLRVINKKNFRLMEMSLLTTIGLSGTLGSLFYSMALMTQLRLPIITQRPPIPAVLTSSTAAQVEHVAVEVHVEPTVCNGEDEIGCNKRNSETLV